MACQTKARQDWVERVAIGASLLCLVHCLALPVAIALLPALANFVSLPETTHLWLLAFVAPAAGLALVAGLRTHGDYRPLMVGGVGLALLTIATLLFAETTWDTALTVMGSLMIVFAHGLNWTLRHGCRQGAG